MTAAAALFILIATMVSEPPSSPPRIVRMVVVAVLERQRVVIARLCDPAEPDFALTPNSALDGAPIAPLLTVPRALHADGTPRFDTFAFELRDRRHLERFVADADVVLSGIDEGP